MLRHTSSRSTQYIIGHLFALHKTLNKPLELLLTHDSYLRCIKTAESQCSHHIFLIIFLLLLLVSFSCTISTYSRLFRLPYIIIYKGCFTSLSKQSQRILPPVKFLTNSNRSFLAASTSALACFKSFGGNDWELLC